MHHNIRGKVKVTHTVPTHQLAVFGDRSIALDESGPALDSSGPGCDRLLGGHQRYATMTKGRKVEGQGGRARANISTDRLDAIGALYAHGVDRGLRGPGTLHEPFVVMEQTLQQPPGGIG